MRLAISIFCILFTATIAFAQSVDYTNEAHGFSMKLPADWKQLTPDRPNLVFNVAAPADGETDLFNETLNVVVVEMGQEADVNELVEQIKPGLAASVKGYKEIADEKATVAGQPARKIIAECPAANTTARSTQWMFTSGQKFYIVTFTALTNTDEKYKPIAQAMVDSFTLKK